MKVWQVVVGIAVAFAVLTGGGTARATNYNITTTSMADTDNGVCTLPEAVRAVSNLAGVNCNFGCDCAAGQSGSNTITLGSGTFSATAEMIVTQPLTINGAGVSSTIIAAAYSVYSDSLFETTGNGALTLNKMTLRNDTPGFQITGIYGHDASTLTLQSVRVTAFTWGGLYLEDTFADIAHCRIDHNSTPSYGAGIGSEHFEPGFPTGMNIYYTEISNNVAEGYGGGIYYAPGSGSQIQMVTIANNSAFSGGGIYAAMDVGGYMQLGNTTVAYNSAATSGGGIQVATDFQFHIAASIIGNNTAQANNGPDVSGYPKAIFSSFGNIYETWDLTFPEIWDEGEDTFIVDPMLGPLMPMGGSYGFLSVCPLLKNALGIDYDPPSLAPELTGDQRGYILSRDGDDNLSFLPDVGAFEKNLRWETEINSFTNKSSDTCDLETVAGYSNGSGMRLLANQIGDYVTFPVWLAEAGTYNFKVGIKTASNAGKFQVKTSASPSSGFVNLGTEKNGYTPSTGFAEINIGNKSSLVAGPYYVRLQVSNPGTGGGFRIYGDHIKVVKQ